MTWTTQAYCTLADVKLALDPNMGSQDDTWISTLIPQAQSDLDSEIGYSFQQDGTVGTPATRTYDGSGDVFLWTDGVVSLVSVVEQFKTTYLSSGTVWQAGPTGTQDITADIILKPNDYISRQIPAHKMVRNSGMKFTQGFQNYVVSGIFGVPYLPGQVYTGVPNDITRACVRLTIHYFKMRDTAYADMVQAQGGIRERYLKSWPDDVMATCANYQRTRFFTHSYL